LNTARKRYDTPDGVQRKIVAPQLGRIGSGLLFGGARPLALGRNLGRVSGLLMPDGVHFAQHRLNEPGPGLRVRDSGRMKERDRIGRVLKNGLSHS
jgi:hypothetical protein